MQGSQIGWIQLFHPPFPTGRGVSGDGVLQGCMGHLHRIELGGITGQEKDLDGL